MKALVLLLTILFSFSVLADCCNFEVPASDEQCSEIVSSHSDNCSNSSEHSEESQHCHCSPICHFKIIPDNKFKVASPASYNSEPAHFSKSLLISNFEFLIFHPPIA